jgi:hypothetical protein
VLIQITLARGRPSRRRGALPTNRRRSQGTSRNRARQRLREPGRGRAGGLVLRRGHRPVRRRRPRRHRRPWAPALDEAEGNVVDLAQAPAPPSKPERGAARLSWVARCLSSTRQRRPGNRRPSSATTRRPPPASCQLHGPEQDKCRRQLETRRPGVVIVHSIPGGWER